MPVRAIIFDIYKTLLEVGPPPAGADIRWTALWKSRFGKNPPLGLAPFQAETERIISVHHQKAKSLGIQFPEIYWPDICAETLPDLRELPPASLLSFLYEHAQLQRAVRLMEGAAPLLRELGESALPLGIASNCQPYTLEELRASLQSAGIRNDLFQPDLSFLSFQAGFSKPNPHVFRILQARLRARGIRAEDTLMVGDRQENDILPAQAQGWQTWLLTPAPPPNSPGGPWAQLHSHLRRVRRLVGIGFSP